MNDQQCITYLEVASFAFVLGGFIACACMAIFVQVKERQCREADRYVLEFRLLISKKNKFNMKKTILVLETMRALLSLKDTQTGNSIDATFDTITISSDNTDVVSITPDETDPNQQDVDGVTPGDANITIGANATYFDSVLQTTVTKPKSVVIPVTVAQPEGEDTTLVVDFKDAAVALVAPPSQEGTGTGDGTGDAAQS